MTPILEEALRLWGLEGAQTRKVAERENTVYEIERGQTRAALRLHRQGYRSDAELASELDWMAALAQGGLCVPAPLPSQSGAVLKRVQGVQIDLLTWLPGVTLDTCFETLPPPARAALFESLGQNMARLHLISDQWTPPIGFTRCRWDAAALVGHSPLWDRFWTNPELTSLEQTHLRTFRDQARARLSERSNPDFGLIHADLVPGNVMVDDGQLHLIDFDDGGYGDRLFDIATALLKHAQSPDFNALKSALLEGYSKERAIDVTDLPLFMALRAVTYVGWNITRMTEPNGKARNQRFIKTALHWIDRAA